jgi:uncharacterized protein YjbI with pentapeptide repeats/SAM-dependent methyltransferase
MSLTVGLSLATIRVLLGLVGVGYSLIRADFGQDASLSNELLKNVAGGAVGNFMYDFVKGGGTSALEEMAKRFKAGDAEKLNHHLQRAARKAQLTATLLAARACAEELKRARVGQATFWSQMLSPMFRDDDERWLIQVSKMWQRKIYELPDQPPLEIVSADDIIRLFDPELLEPRAGQPEASIQQRLVETLKKDALEEIHTERYLITPIPQAAPRLLEEAIRHGWNEVERDKGGLISLNLSASGGTLINSSKQFDWFSLLCGFFNEEYRSNPKVESAMQKYLLLDIRRQQGGSVLDASSKPVAVSLFFEYLQRLDSSFTRLEDLMHAVDGKQDQILGFVQNLLEENRSLHALTRETVKEQHEGTRQAVKDGIGELRELILRRREVGAVSSGGDDGHDLTWTSLSDLGVAGASDEEVGLALIKACNQSAKSLFHRRVKNDMQTPVGHVWDGIWRETDFDGQKYYVRLADNEGVNIDFRVQQMLADSVETNKPCKLWIVGPAGVGKTTVLYRSYFKLIGAVDDESAEARPGPVPMLLQPRNLKAEQVYRLDRQKEADAFLRLILEFWLENRRISISPERKTAVLSSIEHHLKRGNIAILIDGFDEMNRMDFQTSIFESFFETVEHFVCASRPETDIHLSSHKVIKLAPAWDFKTIKTYLHNRLPETHRLAVRPFLNHLARFDKAEWLCNPRNLNIILGLVEGNETPSAPERVLVRALEQGEYRLLEEVYKISCTRLRRLAKLNPKLASLSDIGKQIWQCFEEIAEEQLNTGAFVLKKAGQSGVWELVQQARDLLDRVVGGDTVELRLKNFNLIDFFLTKKLTSQIKSREPLTFCHLWSTSQLMYLSEELRRDTQHPREVVKNIWGKLDDFRLPALDEEQGHRVRSQLTQRKFGAVNLVQLALQIERDIQKAEQADESAAGIKVSSKNLRNLYLEGTDLSSVTFNECRFDGSTLSNANLENSIFRKCGFSHTNFQHANASFATFNYCCFSFDDDMQSTWYQDQPSAVSEMLVQGVKLRGCEGYDLETFGENGAKRFKTRYVGRFWEVFSNNQECLLGDGLREAEDNYYMLSIKEYLSRLPPSSPAYLIDLMAGGSNARLRELMVGVNARNKRVTPHFDNLRVLAIDRDTSHLVDVKKFLGDRFAIVQKNIEGRANLAESLSLNFDGQPAQADLIIGKKALHELRAPLQREILCECAETLKPGGQLILFTDSPVRMSPAGYDLLHQYLEPLRAGELSILELRKLLIDELRFGATDDDCAIFSNLWVLMKDWANHNEHELKNRYFSSIEEIRRWGEEAGLYTAAEPQQAKYVLVARMYNETGINEVGRYLDQNDNRVLLGDEERLIEYLKGSDEYQLFCDFAEAHLWNSMENRPSELGAALNASRKPIAFGEIHDALSGLYLPYSTGAAFEFTVHVIVLEKPVEAAS